MIKSRPQYGMGIVPAGRKGDNPKFGKKAVAAQRGSKTFSRSEDSEESAFGFAWDCPSAF
jgi:hypothetical protein